MIALIVIIAIVITLSAVGISLVVTFILVIVTFILVIVTFVSSFILVGIAIVTAASGPVLIAAIRRTHADLFTLVDERRHLHHQARVHGGVLGHIRYRRAL